MSLRGVQNERLRTQNEALSRLLTEQRQAATKWQAEFLASVSSKLNAHNAAQDELLQRNVGVVQESLAEGMAHRSKRAKLHDSAYTQLAEGCDGMMNDASERTARLQRRAGTHDEVGLLTPRRPDSR